ncbi:MAG TPA: 5'-nucleotidase C-terminal domain-containing protein [Pyrinomonadaceae bacterium]|nr:5'-nucleotidase C-terminal domain-containing protein [Pyrinomonadaceae bacterium]
MKNSARKMLVLSLASLVLVLGAPGVRWALGQQPAPKTATATTQSPATQPATSANVQARVTETAVDASIPDDPPMDKMLAVYSPKVRELDTVIGKLKGELRKGGTGAGSLGNFVTDGMRAQAAEKTGKPIALALMNAGGMRRSTIGEGELRARDVFELLPFENALVTIDLTGEQFLKVMQTIVAKHEAQSGARLVYKTNADKSSDLVSAKIRDSTGERDIDPHATYTIVTIDYLYRVGGSTYGVLQEGKNMKELGITLRDAIMSYVRSETAAGRDIKPNLDGRFVYDRAGSAAPEEVRPQ